ncbi:MAG: alpha/beta hydrolase fold domain-containing protein [Anaerolineae bacterium]|nr:alpha/beta hydrolase fold domain-containing protein [Anaerolineae bacterium]
MASWQFRVMWAMLAGRLQKQTAVRLHENVAETRRSIEKLGARARLPADCRAESVTIGSMAAEWVIPAEAADGRAILYLHGGAYCLGSARSHRFLGGYVARAALRRVLLPDYRLAPEHPFPAAVDDAVAAYHWLLAAGYKPENLTIMGDSAGGGLALAALLALRDAGERLPGTAVCLSPWTDLAGTGDSMTSKRQVDVLLTPELLARYAAWYGNGRDLTHPLISPHYASLAGLPRLLIQVGENEILLDDATRLAARARADGVDITLEVWPGMVHVWHALAALIPESRQAIGRIGEFVH